MFVETEKGTSGSRGYSMAHKGKAYRYCASPAQLDALDPADPAALAQGFQQLRQHCAVDADWVKEAMRAKWAIAVSSIVSAPSRPLDLSGFILDGVDLSGEQDLSGAKFVNADLAGCNLSGTKLLGADFTGAQHVAQADLTGVTQLWSYVPRRSLCSKSTEVPTALAEAAIKRTCSQGDLS